MPTTIHLVRHAQGFHNLHQDTSIPDPYLTPLGVQQSRALGAHFPHKDKITHLVASPMKRTLLTAYHAFQDLLVDKPLGLAGNKKIVVAHPDLQECNEWACDVGSAPAALAPEFGAWADLGRVVDGWNVKTAGSRYAADVEALQRRACAARVWLRDLGRSQEDAVIVVVTHGDFIQMLNEKPGLLWANAEYHTYEFVHPDGNDEHASLREIQQPVQMAKV